MKVSRWGNSLAVRLPSAYVETLSLKEGDEVEISLDSIRKIRSADETRRAEALQALEALARPGPPGYAFNRDEIYDSMMPGDARSDDAA
jgi:antitoxin MazE